MTDAERQAFLRGFDYGAESIIAASDPVLVVAARHVEVTVRRTVRSA